MPRGVSPTDEALRQGRLWRPDALRGSLIGWWDGADLGTLSCDATGGVSEWRDKGPNALHMAQATAANRPIYSPISNVGRPGVTWTATKTLFKTGLALPSTSMNAYCVVRTASTTGGRVMAIDSLEGGDASQDEDFEHYIPVIYDAQMYRSFRSNPQGFLGTAPVAALNTTHVVAHTHSGTENIQYLNGTDNTPTANTFPTRGTTRMYLGNDTTSNTSPSNGFPGVISEALYTKYTGVADHRRVEGYLAWRWGTVERLPASHPYKNSPPLIGA